MSGRRNAEVVSLAMARVRSRDTTPELAFRKALWRRGLRYRLHAKDLPGKPDLVLPKARLAIFIDGDFWHGRQWRTRGFSSVAEQFRHVHGREYWVQKIERNVGRDLEQTAELVRSGWRVVRFWESEITTELERCVGTVARAVAGTQALGACERIGERAFAEFFAGIGLVRLGLEQCGWYPLFANDIDPQKAEMYRHNFPDDPADQYVLGDVHELRGNDVPTIALATASFPCTDLSLAGRRKGLAGKQSGSLWAFLRILDEMGSRRPPLVVLENVPGFLTSHKGDDFRRTLLALTDLGYGCDVFMMDAVWFVPQSRARLFVIGLQEDVGPLAVAEQPAFYESRVRPREIANRIFTERDVRWRIRELPDAPRGVHQVRDIVEEITEDSGIWWSRARVDYLLDQMSQRHRVIVERMLKSQAFEYGTVYRRMRGGRSMAELRVDGIAGCLRTPRGGSSRQILLRAGRGEYSARYMTAREYARLQGVPDSYRIEVPMNQALFGFGDAVCVPVIEWIGCHYLNPAMSELVRGKTLGRAGLTRDA